MRALAIAFFFLGVGFLFLMADNDPDYRIPAIATNYIQYRQAVQQHVFDENNTAEGVIAQANLPLPLGWIALRDWQSRNFNGNCYIWGETSEVEAQEILRQMWQSHGTGRARNGRLVPAHGENVVIPNFIPNNSVVTVFVLP